MVWNKTPQDKINSIIVRLLSDFSLRYGDVAKEFNVSEWLVSEIARKHFTDDQKKQRYSEINRYAKLKSNPMTGRTRDKHPNSKEEVIVVGYLTEWAPPWWTGLFPKGNRCFVHQRVWCEANGITGVPKGMDIHHKDENKFNNELSNLQCLSRSDHMKIHCRSNLSSKRNDYPKGVGPKQARSAEVPEKECDIV